MRRVKKGDKSAFDLLFSRYQHKILALISRFVRDQHEVEDVAQEAFIKAYRALPRFRGDSAFYTWLYRIAINTAKNHLVSRGRRPPGSDIDAEDAEHLDGGEALRQFENPENSLATRELSEEIDAARAEEARQRAVERLAAHEGEIDLAGAMAALDRASARIRVIERRQRRRPAGAPRPGSGPPPT